MSSHCGYPDFDLDNEDPFNCCSVPCIAATCENNAPFTERQYLSDFCCSKRESHYNLGKFFPASECCDGPVCLECAIGENFFCIFCLKFSKVHFLDKNDFCSEKTSSRSVDQWFQKLGQFNLFQEKLGKTCQLFFYWLQKDFSKRQCSWEFYSWDSLCLDTPKTKTLICEFEHFLHSSKMLVSHTFFPRVIPVKFDSNFQCISIKREKIPKVFLEACYGSPFSISFERREMLKQFQIGFVGTLSLRLDQSRQNNFFLIPRKIFNRIMLNLIVS